MAECGAKIDYEIRAEAIADAAYLGDDRACKKHSISLRSLQRFRRQLRTDGSLAEAVARKRLAFDRKWAEDLDISIGKATRAIGEIADQIIGNPDALKIASRNPAMVEALAKALHTVAGVKLASKVIDARIAAGLNPEQPQIQEPKPVGALGPGIIDIGPEVQPS